MVNIEKEPSIRVGLMSGVEKVNFSLDGPFVDAAGASVTEGAHTASSDGDLVRWHGAQPAASAEIKLSPLDPESSRFTVHGVKIGIDFHWEREESQQFPGHLIVRAHRGGLTIINDLPLESYLVSVISSEMSASCPAELLRAHAIVSRSWLLATPGRAESIPSSQSSEEEMIRWYERESHRGFDVCADDHCQRYQGISKAFSRAAFDAVSDTRGVVLVYGDDVCDTRYAKSCGGMTEIYSSVWLDKDVPYLKPVYDGPGGNAPGYRLPLSVDANAEDWITSSPIAYCGMTTPDLLAGILTGFDQETPDFYRWRIDYAADELSEILTSRLGVEFGRIRSLMPVERGESGRIIKLRVLGEKRSLVIGKELEIRRALSRSHLYSSAFVVRPAADFSEYPSRFSLLGAGWGHGVGLCQIGAAVMADRGHSHQEILSHYFESAALKTLY